MKRKRIFFALTALAIACAAMSGCADRIPEPLVSKAETAAKIPDLPPVQSPYPASFDNEIFESSPLTVVSLSPSLTEIIYELGFGDRLIAVSDYCDYPEDVETKAKAGSPANPDVETLTALAPEILLTQSPIAATDALLLRQAGIRIVELSEPSSFAELCDIYYKLALIFCGVVEAQPTAQAAFSEMDGVLLEIAGNAERKKFVVVEDYADGGLMLSPPNSLSSDVFAVFGDNLWSGPGYFANDDELFVISPELVFYSDKVDRDDVKKTFPHADLVEIDFSRVERPSSRLADLLLGAYEECS